MSPLNRNSRCFPSTCLAGVLVVAVTLAGCKGIPQPGERRASRDVSEVASVYRPDGARPVLPALTTNSPFSDFMKFAMLNQPDVAAAYYDWQGAVENITVQRSRPDPQLTFEAYIADTILQVMPGLAVDIPGPGKLKVAGTVASAQSEGKYFEFESSVLDASFALKKSYYQLYFLDDRLRVDQQTLALADDLERLTRAQNDVGKATLQDILRAQIEQERLNTEITNLTDSRAPLMADFKAALGLASGDADPPVPGRFESTPLDLSFDQLLALALAHNPRLATAESEVRRAEASLQMAYKARIPDFNVALEADVKAVPTVFNPQAGMTLPIWRDKIAAEIAAAQADKRAAQARLSSEQIGLAVNFAEKSYMYREATRDIRLLEEQLLPKARLSLEVARSGYASGGVDFINLIDAERTLLDLELQEVDARTQRELSLAELSLVIAGVPPPGAPILDSRRPNLSPTQSTER